MSFKNKVVLVTGASSGIGAAAAISFSALGARMVLVGLDQSKLDAVTARCDCSLAFCVDITKDDEIHRIIDQTIQKCGQLDILVNSAGMSTMTDSILTGNMMKAYDTIMDLNVRAIVHMTTVAAPHLVKTKGNIINLSSAAGLRPPFQPSWINYNISKATLNHFTSCAAAELGAYGVRVNTVSPGPVRTEFLKNANCPADWDNFKKYSVLDRITEPEEIAELILFLASDKAIGITGSNFISDNGILVKVNINLGGSKRAEGSEGLSLCASVLSMLYCRNLEGWIRQREVDVNFRLSQILIKHGCFGEYLCRIGRKPTAQCHHRGREPYSAQHTLKVLPVCLLNLAYFLLLKTSVDVARSRKRW